MKWTLHSLLALVVFASAPAARAQAAIYVMGSAATVSGIPGTGITPAGQTGTFADQRIWAYGGTFGVYDDFLHLGPIRLGGDARGFIENHHSSTTNLNGNKLGGGLAGLRLSLHLPVIPFKPYLQAEIGGVSTNYGQNPFRSNTFAYQMQAGADFTIFPHLDLRAEYGGGQLHRFSASTSNTLQQISGGLVVRF